MFINVHRPPFFLVVCFALFLMSIVFNSAQAQEKPLENSTTTAQVTETTPPNLLRLYKTEPVPGGDSVVGDFVVGPGKIDVTLNPGESKTIEMMVTNRTGDVRRFKIETEDAAGTDDVDTPIVLLGDDTGPNSLKDFIYIPHESFDLEHNQRARIPVTITIPENAESAGLYGSVLVQTVAVQGSENNVAGAAQSPIVARVGTLFFVTVPGDVERAAGLKQFGTIPEQKFYQGSPINFGILYENTGPIHVAPYGEIRIHNMFGEEVGFEILEPWFVLPNSIRLREVSWTREALFGQYTATVYINRSYDDIVDEMTYTFWVLPWKPLLVGFAALFFAIFIIRGFFKRFEFKRKTE